ncbi:S41 family peptidase [Dyadobacter psychrotolerans]|uniref:Tricorn protease homolog n=1 Tax=Dyadobacter psychrotolerans TaxID=2541721 RepID=A0A4R5DN98_9BACT|nr:S41 family peptidase [Dyadobacter psychrotolerans]TDE15669.1 peptidase S41 [Dyadobacter psychrotolerans]
MYHRISIFVLLLFCVLIACGQTTPKWVRYPSISPDGSAIVFTYKGDLYRVASSGGQALQLTFHEAHDYQPVWSPDGKQIAFASDRYGNFDLFIMSAQGGEAKRLTFHSNDETPFTFTPDGRSVVFGGVRQDQASHRQYPAASQPELYAVPVQGGRVKMVLTSPAEYVRYTKDGKTLVYHDKKGGENEWRKHHKSSIARDIWTYDTKTQKHSKITSFYGEDRQPVLADNDKSIYYLSEESGNFNIHKLALTEPSKNTKITSLKTHPVRFLSASDSGLLSFSFGGELYTVREGENPKKLDISIITQDKSNKDSFVAINGGVKEFSVSPDGKEVAFIARGEVFVTSVDGKMTKRITNTPQQERFVEFAPDGKSLVYASERDNHWQIFQASRGRKEEPFFYASTLIDEKALVKTKNDNYQPKLSPDGKKLAYVEDRRTLKVMEISTGNSTVLLTPKELYHMQDGDQYFSWSPDSKWILANVKPTMVNGEVTLLDAEGKKPMTNLTKSGYDDYEANWVNGGKQILWVSNRHGMKDHASSGSSQADVYTMFLTREAWDKYNLSKDEYNLSKEIDKLKGGDKPKDKKDSLKIEKEKQNEPIVIELNGIYDRKARLTIHSSNLSDAVLSKDGEKLYYLARFEKNSNLWSTNLRTKETKMEMSLDDTDGSLKWDKEQKNLFLLAAGKITKITIEGNKKEAIQIAGDMMLDSEAERAYMFEHVWLRTRKIFYTPEMHGADWDGLKKVYLGLLPHVGNSYEFAELLSEMIGELNVSHAGARFGRSVPEADATASLGILLDYSHTTDGILITEVLQQGPLDKAGFIVKPGHIIEKIDGETIVSDRDISRYLNRKAGKFTLLEILDPKSKKREQITVKPITLAEENVLLYKRWVKQNQAEVDSLSKGKLGYVHIPGMNDGQYRNVYEEMMGKYADRQGVVVDTRFNGGGDLVSDLAMFFTGDKFITYATADRSIGYEPTFRWTKPTLAMFNEANYSDGHCFSCGYTELKIGKTVGMPVPGTCSFAGWELLPDGTRWGAVPISAKNKAGEWLENNETRPGFEVKNDPALIAIGKDQQLEKAVEELLKDIAPK